MELVVAAEVEEDLRRRRISISYACNPTDVLRRMYFFGLVCLQIFTGLIQPFFFPYWEFLPLMLTSVYCFFGMSISWYLLWKAYWMAWRLEKI